MKNITKVFAMYLPQYHEIEENSKFWGKGFTDWVGVKNSKPLFNGHRQPRVPLNNNYYDLSQVESIRWQCKLAREAGIDGFGIYHYWFNESQNLLDTPPKIILNNPDIDISFFFAWDNTSWVRSWSKLTGNDWFPKGDKKIETNEKGQQYLVKYELGREPQWKAHFDWMMDFFKDDRYEKKDGCPLFMILNPQKDIMEMCLFWNKLAIERGLKGVHFIFRWDAVHAKSNELIKDEHYFRYEPSTSGWSGFIPRAIYRIERTLGITRLKKYDYDSIWKKIIRYASADKTENLYYCAYVDYDDTPRRGSKGRIITGMVLDSFYRYFKELYEISKRHNKDYMFITAWNEWGEGAYLEPDEDNGNGLLDAVRKVLNE